MNTGNGCPPPSLAIVGAGHRGAGYARWSLAHPSRARVVAVAEPVRRRRELLAEQHGIPQSRQFSDWRELVAAGRVADAAIVATPDVDHVEPAIGLSALGYALMVEKPMAPTEADCRRLVAALEADGTLFTICHVLRYAPYTRLIKRLLGEGRLGDVVSIQHLEPVGYWHFAHSYVRGNWRRTSESSPTLLAKSCHDIDWLRYVVGGPIEQVASFGGLQHFTSANQPSEAADRCLDCPLEASCLYSAKRFYLESLRAGRVGLASIIAEEPTEAGVLHALRHGPYGRCVYHSDNDALDNQVVLLRFAGGVTATFTMTAFGRRAPRETQIFGTKARLDCDGETVRLFDFETERSTRFEIRTKGTDAASGLGGRSAIMDAFTLSVQLDDAGPLLAGPSDTLESHLAVFAAERARLNGTVEHIPTQRPAGSANRQEHRVERR